MSLWVDRHRPNQLKKLDCHPKQAQQLKRLVDSGDFPHLLFYGPSGSGKKTLVMCLLRELYGAGAEKLRLEHQSFETPSKKKIEIVTIASNYHIEVNPSDVGIYDRVIIQELIKTVAQTHQFDSTGQREFKVIVLTEVDRLTKEAQHALRRTMEKYVATCRLILIATSTSKVIPAIRSRCLGIRVPAPSTETITKTVQSVGRKEAVDIPEELARRISEKSNRNLRRALLSAEACKMQQTPMQPDQKISERDWEVYLQETANQILQEQSPARLLAVRDRLYELLVHCIPPETIFRELVKCLVKNCDNQLKADIISAAASYEHRMNLGSKPIFHLEGFVAKFMSLYKRFWDQEMGAF